MIADIVSIATQPALALLPDAGAFAYYLFLMAIGSLMALRFR
jgi:hypothetical protein